MQATARIAAIALLAATISSPLLAGERTHKHKGERHHAQKQAATDGFDYGMQAVLHDSAADAPGYGWRYFTDPATRRAVVISPQGDYYYSHGKGLHWIAAEQS